MSKKPTMTEMMNTVNRRYGKTLGASKGSKPAPKGKVRVKPRKSSLKIEFNKKF